MSKYIYPAVFQEQNEGGYTVIFPDIPGCITQGETINESIEMAEDALCLMLYDAEVSGEPIPNASNPIDIKTDKNSFVAFVSCDTLKYRKLKSNKSVKKTLTVPQWLDELALSENINFSQVLQNALKEQLHISNTH